MRNTNTSPCTSYQSTIFFAGFFRIFLYQSLKSFSMHKIVKTKNLATKPKKLTLYKTIQLLHLLHHHINTTYRVIIAYKQYPQSIKMNSLQHNARTKITK